VVAHSLADLFYTTQSDMSLSACFVGRHTGSQIIVGMHLENALQFIGKIPVRMP